MIDCELELVATMGEPPQGITRLIKGFSHSDRSTGNKGGCVLALTPVATEAQTCGERPLKSDGLPR